VILRVYLSACLGLEQFQERIPAIVKGRKCAVGDRLVWLWFHQVVVNQLIGLGSYC
jgi:hypothetical protein